MKKPQIKKEGNVWVLRVWNQDGTLVMIITSVSFETILAHFRIYEKRCMYYYQECSSLGPGPSQHPATGHT